MQVSELAMGERTLENVTRKKKKKNWNCVPLRDALLQFGTLRLLMYLVSIIYTLTH